ncbi:MAG: GerAB/ArcD/ProY family transporter [Blautia sp.]
MFADNRIISQRQLFRQMVLCLTGIMLIAAPAFPGISGSRGVICLFLICGLFVPGSIYFVRIRVCYEKPWKYFGTFWSRIFCLFYVSYLFFTGILLLLLISRIAERYFIEGSISVLVILLSGAVCYMGCHQGLERRGRMGEAAFPLILFLLGLMLLLALGKMNLRYLSFCEKTTWKGWIQSFYEAFCLYLPVFFLPFTLANVERPGKGGRTMNRAVLLITFLQSFSLILLQGVFGKNGYRNKKYPLFDLMGGVKLPGDFLERVDIFWIGAVLFCIFYAMGSIFFYSHAVLEKCHMESWAFRIAVLLVAAAVFTEKMGISLEFYGKLLTYVYGPLFPLSAIGAGMVLKRKEGGAQ